MPHQRYSLSQKSLVIAAALLVAGPASGEVVRTAPRACRVPPGERLEGAPARLLRGAAEVMRSGRPSKLDALPDADVYLLYYGASWCGPCRAFARALKPIYESGEPAVLRYEVIFVSMDEPGDDVAYVREAGMPWPFIRARATPATDWIGRLGGRTLPNLVAVDRTGGVLCRAVSRGGRSAGVRQTLEQVRELRREATVRRAAGMR